jgi:hypothetical protein
VPVCSMAFLKPRTALKDGVSSSIAPREGRKALPNLAGI